jgi:hypothetical protein
MTRLPAAGTSCTRPTPNGDGTWKAGSGAIFDLRTNALQARGATSADAAGLSILAGLVRYDEAAAGRMDHDNRFSNDALHALGGLTGNEFEAVDTASLISSPDSAACRR